MPINNIKTILGKLSDTLDKIVSPIIYKLYLLLIRHVYDTSTKLINLTNLQIREILPEASLPSDDEELDKIIHVTSLMLLMPHAFNGEGPDSLHQDKDKKLAEVKEKNRKIYKENIQRVQELTEKVKDCEDIKSTLKKYWLIKSYIATLYYLEDKKLENYYLDKAKTIDPDAKAIDPKEIQKIRKITKKSIKKIRSNIADRGTFKMSWDARTVGVTLASLAPLFFIIGYLYNKILLNAFDINVEDFFSLESYISASIEKIEYIIVAAVFAILGLMLGKYIASRRSNYEIELSIKRNIKESFIFLSLLSLSAFYSWYNEDYLQVAFWLYFLSILLILIVARYIADKFFEKSTMPIFYISFILLLLAVLAHTVYREIYLLTHSEISKIKKYKFIFTDNYSYSENNMVLILRNQDFFIFYDVKEKDSIIVPKNQVLSVTSIKK